MAISSRGIAHDGPVALKMGIGGYPRMAEELFVQRAITVCKNLGTRVHLTSISSAGSVELIREAKGKEISVTADSTPHHLALTDGCLLGYDTECKNYASSEGGFGSRCNIGRRDGRNHRLHKRVLMSRVTNMKRSRIRSGSGWRDWI